MRQVLEGSRRNPEAFETLGNILVHLGRLHEAAINYERIRDWKADQRAVYRKRLADAATRIAVSDAPVERQIRQAQRETNPAKAEALLQQALSLDPENTRALRSLLRCQFARRESVAALGTARQLIALSPEDGAAHTLFVVLALEALRERPLSEDDHRALVTHLKAAEDDPSVTPMLLYARGLLSLKSGQAQSAVQDLEQAARLDPNALAVYPRLAEAKSRAGDAEGAKWAMAEFERRQREREEPVRLSRDSASR